MFETTINPGDTLKLFSSGGPIPSNRDLFYAGVSLIEEQGFAVKYDESLFERYHYLAGITAKRSDNLISILECKETKAMWAARGWLRCTPSSPITKECHNCT